MITDDHPAEKTVTAGHPSPPYSRGASETACGKFGTKSQSSGSPGGRPSMHDPRGRAELIKMNMPPRPNAGSVSPRCADRGPPVRCCREGGSLISGIATVALHLTAALESIDGRD